jgi:type I restriction-modification system DNA methylase subunit
MSHQIAENIYRPFVEEQEHIRGKLFELYRKAKNELSDVSPWLDIVVFIKKYNFQNVHNEIFGYVYENYLKELYEDEKKGQYFTDPSVVNFMLEQVGYTAKEIRNKIKVGELDKLSIVGYQ